MSSADLKQALGITDEATYRVTPSGVVQREGPLFWSDTKHTAGSALRPPSKGLFGDRLFYARIKWRLPIIVSAALALGLVVAPNLFRSQESLLWGLAGGIALAGALLWFLQRKAA